jgi:hypothetical protein
MAAEVRVEPVEAAQLDALLPLIAAYQRFYEVADVDDQRNRAFFARFLAPSEDGMLLGARRDGALIGYACLYWHFTSLVPAETVLMNDLFVIEASAAVARERGAYQLQWVTAPDNAPARRLYETTGAEFEPSIEYELRL